MKFLNKAAENVFLSLIEGLKQPGNAKKVDNTNGTFMPVHVEMIYENEHGKHFSIAHYYEQNGDLMKDPEMTFLNSLKGGVFPMTFEQDGGIPICQVAVKAEDGKNICFSPKMQKDITRFANMWMKNIKDQQRL